jgi:hypothetical protein
LVQHIEDIADRQSSPGKAGVTCMGGHGQTCDCKALPLTTHYQIAAGWEGGDWGKQYRQKELTTHHSAQERMRMTDSAMLYHGSLRSSRAVPLPQALLPKHSQPGSIKRRRLALSVCLADGDERRLSVCLAGTSGIGWVESG